MELKFPNFSTQDMMLTPRKNVALSTEFTTPAESPNSNGRDSPLAIDTDYQSPVSHASARTRRRSLSSQAMSLLHAKSVGSLWTVELATLKQAGSNFEAVECLRRIRSLLADVDAVDRIRYCQPDYDITVKLLRKQKKLWNADLFKEILTISSKYFNKNLFQKLPTSIFVEILMFIPVDEMSPLFRVNEEWYDLCCSNETWTNHYRRKFLLNNPGRLPSRSSHDFNVNMMFSFQQRLADPQIGDKIEVAWRGKFRLETSDVYQGLAWWVAEVVDKHPAQERYKIRYPGWDSRWDEWVPRARLRWKVSTNTLVAIQVGDVVELWCCGANVPGAWLEAKVKRIRNGRYCLGRIVSSGFLWVERERIRLLRRRSDDPETPGQMTASPPTSFLYRIVNTVTKRINNLLPRVTAEGAGLVEAIEEVPEPNTSVNTCTVM